MRCLKRQWVLLFVCCLALLNIVLAIIVGIEHWKELGTGQGLLLTILGSVILAIPDVPELRRWASPSTLQQGLDTLYEDGKIQTSEAGFDELVNLIDEHTQRVNNPDSIQWLEFAERPYGEPPIKAGFEGDDLANFQLTRGRSIDQWVAEKRDRRVRLSGILLLISGFVFQFIAFVI
jgi:hypothetical protein